MNGVLNNHYKQFLLCALPVCRSIVCKTVTLTYNIDSEQPFGVFLLMDEVGNSFHHVLSPKNEICFSSYFHFTFSYDRRKGS